MNTTTLENFDPRRNEGWIRTWAGPKKVNSITGEWWVITGPEPFTQHWCCSRDTTVYLSEADAQASCDRQRQRNEELAARHAG